MDLEDMKNIDIRNVEADTLMDIKNIKIDMNKSRAERMTDYINQIGNPYCFRCGKMTVKLSYSETDTTIEKCMEGYFRSL